MRRVEKAAVSSQLRRFTRALSDALAAGRRLIVVIDGKHHEVVRPAEVGADFLMYTRHHPGAAVFVPFGRIDQVILEDEQQRER
jgi:hypothetical protein